MCMAAVRARAPTRTHMAVCGQGGALSRRDAGDATNGRAVPGRATRAAVCGGVWWGGGARRACGDGSGGDAAGRARKGEGGEGERGGRLTARRAVAAPGRGQMAGCWGGTGAGAAATTASKSLPARGPRAGRGRA